MLEFFFLMSQLYLATAGGRPLSPISTRSSGSNCSDWRYILFLR